MTVSIDDFKHTNDVLRSECSEDKAGELLELAAGYLERGEVMPKDLADFIAEAFRITASFKKDDYKKRAAKLAQLLNLTAPNRRPKYTKIELSLGLRSYAMYAAAFDWSETKTIAEIAGACGVGKTRARTWWKEWKAENPNALAEAAYLAASWKATKEKN